jgi:hypothetical protein
VAASVMGVVGSPHSRPFTSSASWPKGVDIQESFPAAPHFAQEHEYMDKCWQETSWVLWEGG